ncbi:glycoside hydrolase family 43 protein, partial [Parabacteroides sp. PF5-9]|uniref:glycoside hydrolase family 43 protein n=1 Tax=Parabacteroides sp. PF5-9 TaxID=1742404 RepID=UPI002474B1C2
VSLYIRCFFFDINYLLFMWQKSVNLFQCKTVSCYSSKDLYSWKNEGVALSVVDDTTHLLARGCKIERPKVIYNQKTNKFVMWWHHDLLGDGHKNALTGVAVSDHVNGPYILRSVFRPNSWNWPINVKSYHKEEIPSTTLDFYSGGELPSHPDSLNLLGRDYEKGQMSRDMTLFVDDDGTAYHIYSSEENSTLHISQLTDDYLTYSGKYSRFFIGRFMEAPAMFKKNDKYYLIMSGCTGWLPNSGRSAVASSIWGPWVELGNPFVGDNAGISFDSQGTFVLPSPSRKDEFIYIGDRWTPEQADNATYIWLPIRFEGIKPVIEWKDRWRY